jgi:hypothetical protein
MWLRFCYCICAFKSNEHAVPLHVRSRCIYAACSAYIALTCLHLLLLLLMAVQHPPQLFSLLPGGEIMHVDMNVFSAKDWKLSWLLLLPFVNYAKDWIRCDSGRDSIDIVTSDAARYAHRCLVHDEAESAIAYMLALHTSTLDSPPPTCSKLY